MGVIKDTFEVGGTLMEEVWNRGSAVAGPTSLSEYTRMARVCPRVLIEEGLRGLRRRLQRVRLVGRRDRRYRIHRYGQDVFEQVRREWLS